MYKKNIFKRSSQKKEFNAKKPKDYLMKLSNEQCFLLIRQFKRLKIIKENSKKLAIKFHYHFKDNENVSQIDPKFFKDINLIRYPLLVKERNS